MNTHAIVPATDDTQAMNIQETVDAMVHSDCNLGIAGLFAELSDDEIADGIIEDWPGADLPEREAVVVAVAALRAKFLAEQSKPTLILTIQQAEAVHSAMCALNNVGLHTFRAALGAIHITQDETGAVTVDALTVERHADQAAFAAAYGLDL